jgi:hypothetical protein
VAQQLNLAGNGTVMAGPLTGSGAGSAIDVLRSQGRSDHFSSVDDADYTVGQIVVAQALYEQMTAGRTGNYGALNNPPSAVPSPAPTSSPSTTASPTGKQSAGPKHAGGRSATPGANASASAR